MNSPAKVIVKNNVDIYFETETDEKPNNEKIKPKKKIIKYQRKSKFDSFQAHIYTTTADILKSFRQLKPIIMRVVFSC